jgi:hypothetical protein
LTLDASLDAGLSFFFRAMRSFWLNQVEPRRRVNVDLFAVWASAHLIDIQLTVAICVLRREAVWIFDYQKSGNIPVRH